MIDYQLYRDSVGISNVEMISCVQQLYGKFSKPHASFVNHSDKTGLCLTPEAEKHLVLAYGPGPGLAFVKRKRKPEKRKKAHRICFSMDDELYAAVKDLKKAAGFDSFQALIEAALIDWLKVRENHA